MASFCFSRSPMLQRRRKEEKKNKKQNETQRECNTAIAIFYKRKFLLDWLLVRKLYYGLFHMGWLLGNNRIYIIDRNSSTIKRNIIWSACLFKCVQNLYSLFLRWNSYMQYAIVPLKRTFSAHSYYLFLFFRLFVYVCNVFVCVCVCTKINDSASKYPNVYLKLRFHVSCALNQWILYQSQSDE